MVEKKPSGIIGPLYSSNPCCFYCKKKKKPDTKGPILYDFIPMQCLEVVNAERERAISGYWVVWGGGEGALSFDGIFLG